MGDRDVLTEPVSAPEGGWYSNHAATFGDRLAGAREALGLSQAELARKLGVELASLRAWEDDLREPRANRLQILAGVLNVSLMWLLSGEGEGISEPSGEPALNADVGAILAEFRQVRATLQQATERIGQLEKRLRKAVKEPA